MLVLSKITNFLKNETSSKKGYTLIELLTVIGIFTIIASFTFATFFELNKLSNQRVDQSRITIYNKAFEDFRFTDYSALQSTAKEKVVLVEGGKVKINQYLNLGGHDLEALSKSGRGNFPQTKQECIAAIRAYCGTNDILPTPAAGMSYGYFYNKLEGICVLKAISDVPTTSSDWIHLDDYYYLITNFVRGDANGDGMFNNSDIAFLSAFINGTGSLTGYHYNACDLNDDGLVNSADKTIAEKAISEGKVLFW